MQGAAANALPDPVAEELKEERRARLMAEQERISLIKLKSRVGQRLTVLVDQPGRGRSSAEAPEIDGVVHFRGGKAGEFRNVLIERADAHDLFGRLQ